MKHFSNPAASCLAATIMWGSMQFGLAAAQEAQPASEHSTIEEIVVTALKRASTVQDTPVSITALTGSRLEALGARGVEDYFRQIPNMNMTSTGSGYQRLSFRGVQAAGEATTGVYYDETPVTGPTGTASDPGAQQPNIDLFDVERIEALRGPQGTLYGSGSMGGTLRIIYNKPDTREYAGRVQAQYTGTSDGDPGNHIKAMVNVPLIYDTLGARIVLAKERQGGYIDNVTLGTDDVNEWNTETARMMLAYTPLPTLTLYGSAILQQSDSDDSTSTWLESLGGHSINTESRQPSKKDLELYNLTARWQLPFAELTATGSHYEWDTLDTLDYSMIYRGRTALACRTYYSLSAACSVTQRAAFGALLESHLPAIWYTPANLQVWTGEARLVSTLPGPLEWTVGYFYEDRSDYMDSKVAASDPASGQILMPLTDLTLFRYVESQQTQNAIFGEIGYHVLPELTLTAGVRHYSYDKQIAGEVILSSAFAGATVSPYQVAEVSADGWVYRFNATYRRTSRLLFYSTVASGFRPGGANNTPGVSASAIFPYQPDKVVNYEVGMKSSWWQQRLTANLALFVIDWSDMQVQATSANGAFQVITNAGKARLKGAELELTVQPVDRLILSLAAGYVDARLTEDQVNPGITATGTTGRDGDRVPNVPRGTGAAEVSYRWPVSARFNGMALFNYTYTGESLTGFRANYPYNEEQGDFGLANVRVGLEAHDLGIYLFANNLFNAEPPQNVTTLATGWTRRIVGPPPLTIGINVRKDF